MSSQIIGKIEEHDKNMVIETQINKPDIKFYDIRREPFDVYGLYNYKTEPYFMRLPEAVAQATSEGVTYYAKESAGGRIRFCTDSPYIAISVEYVRLGRNSHTPLEASGGFDLYEDYPNGIRESRFLKSFIPPYDTTDKYEQHVDLPNRKLRYFTVNMPLHSVVKNVYIGLSNDAKVCSGAKYRNDTPVIIYGSSIVNGTGPSRPGLTYSNILARRLNLNITNIGFSGAAKAEPAIVEYLSELPASIFVCDYDHNAPNALHLKNTHYSMYKRYRQSNPQTPYVIISRPDVMNKYNECYPRRDIILDTFHRARAEGDNNIYYIDGESFFLGREENDCTVDTTHPNDHGNYLMAESIEWVLRKIINSGKALL